MRVPFFEVDCSGRELDYVRQVLESGWLTTATFAAEFERRFADRLGARHAIAVNSCTSALHLACEAVGIEAGDTVLVPSLTFTSTAEVVRYLGAEVALVDVDPTTGLLTPELLDAACRAHPGARACLPVHYAGQAAMMRDEDGREGLISVARRHGVALVEDAAHAFPASRAGCTVGTFGPPTCFSFYANKTITTGEGGMLVTDDDEIARRARLMRLHGIDRDVWDRFRSDVPKWEYDVVEAGFKYNMPDVLAAIGLAQLERADDLRAGRARIAARYLEALADVEEIALPRLEVAHDDHAWHLFPIVLRPDAPIERNALIERLAARGISTSVHYKPLHRMRVWSERCRQGPADLPGAESVWQGTVSLPIYPTMRDEQVDFVCESLLLAAAVPRRSHR